MSVHRVPIHKLSPEALQGVIDEFIPLNAGKFLNCLLDRKAYAVVLVYQCPINEEEGS